MNRFALAMALATSLFLANCSTGERDPADRAAIPDI